MYVTCPKCGSATDPQVLELAPQLVRQVTCVPFKIRGAYTPKIEGLKCWKVFHGIFCGPWALYCRDASAGWARAST